MARHKLVLIVNAAGRGGVAFGIEQVPNIMEKSGRNQSRASVSLLCELSALQRVLELVDAFPSIRDMTIA
jgi:hypothetical protein